jgi:dipeptide/tripeptide permease
MLAFCDGIGENGRGMNQLPERERATGNSLMTMSWDAGWSIAPLVSGLVQVRTGFTPLFVATTIVYTLGMIAVYGFFVRLAKRIVSPRSQHCP